MSLPEFHFRCPVTLPSPYSRTAGLEFDKLSKKIYGFRALELLQKEDIQVRQDHWAIVDVVDKWGTHPHRANADLSEERRGPMDRGGKCCRRVCFQGCESARICLGPRCHRRDLHRWKEPYRRRVRAEPKSRHEVPSNSRSSGA